MKVITQTEIKQINELYTKLHTYAAVSRATGFSPATVKKYVIPNYQIVDEKNIVRYSKENLPEFNYKKFRGVDWGELCELSLEETKEIYELWKEMEL